MASAWDRRLVHEDLALVESDQWCERGVEWAEHRRECLQPQAARIFERLLYAVKLRNARKHGFWPLPRCFDSTPIVLDDGQLVRAHCADDRVYRFYIWGNRENVFRFEFGDQEATTSTPTVRRIASNGDVAREFRLLFRVRACPDCRETSHRWTCMCGYERPLSDEFYVVDRFTPVRWHQYRGPVPRLTGLGSFDLYRIREAARAAEIVDDGVGRRLGVGNTEQGWLGNGAVWDDVDGINEAFTGEALAAAAPLAPPVYFTTDSGGVGAEDDPAIARERLVISVVESFERQARR